MNPPVSLLTYLFAVALASACFTKSPNFVFSAHGFEDAFEDGDSAGWTHFDPMNKVGLAAPSLFQVANGVFRMEANPPAADAAGPGRIFSYIDDAVFSSFYCAVDVVDWADELDQAFGILGRADKIGLGQTTGYVCNYDPNQSGGQPGGQFQINRVIDEASNPTIAAANVTLQKDHDYRMVFRGEGNRLIGALYDLEDLTKPVTQIETNGDIDEAALTYPEGKFGLFCFYRGDDATEPTAKPVVVFDNFVILDANPRPELLPGIASGVAADPQVLSHEPSSGAAFYPAANGLRFTVDPGPRAGVLPIRLFLNDVEVPSESIAFGDADGMTTGFYQGLEPNQNIDARLMVGSMVSRWHFDTFEESSITAGEALVIEAENYNYNAGQYLDNPKPTGLTVTGAVLPDAAAGFFERVGEEGIDYHDLATGPAAANDYRATDNAGLRAASDDVEPGPALRDVARVKYTESGAQDYAVFQTEAGEWLNYTRKFPAGDYHVYLRAASTTAQEVMLDRVTSDPTRPDQTTESLGRFAVPNQSTLVNWLYTPLTDPDGKALSVPLSGETTLRLTMGGEEGAFAFRRVLTMNFLLFIPASQDDPNLVVASGSVFGQETGAANASLTLRNGGAARPLTISGMTIEGEDAAFYAVSVAPAVLAAGEAASIKIGFDPKGREGVFHADLVIASDDESNPERRVDLSATVPVSSGLLVHYAFDETVGATQALDSSGYRRHGQYATTGGAAIQLGQAALAGGAAVRLVASGADAAYVEIPTSARLPALDALTLSLWFQQEAGATNATILSKGIEPANPFAVALDQGTVAWGAAGESVLQTVTAFTFGAPHHLLIRYESGTVAIFVDGALVEERADGPAFDDRSPSALFIGALTGGALGFTGVLDDFQLYQRALSAEEILFLNGNPGQALGGGGEGTTDPSAEARIVAFGALEAGQLAFTFASAAGHRYTIEASESLQADSWATLQEIDATGEETTISLDRGGETIRFYRVRF